METVVIRAARIAATIFVLAIAAWAINEKCLKPSRCNRAKFLAKQAVERAFDVGYNPSDIAQTMRVHQRTLRDCTACTPRDVGLYMELAALQRYIGRNDDAEATYQTALRYDERPELYFNLGETQVALKKEKEAIASFARAAVFNPYTLQKLDAGMRAQVEAEVQNSYPWVEPLFPAQRSW